MKQTSPIGKMLSLLFLIAPFALKAQNDTLTKDSHIIFAIPDYTDDEWDGGHILTMNLEVKLKDGRVFTAIGEHRNTDVKKSRAIPIFLTWLDPTATRKISFENVESVHITTQSEPGKPSSADGNKCRFREETELKFSNGKLILTGYYDAQLLLPIGKYGKVERTTHRNVVGEGFEYDESKMLVDGKVH